MSPYQHDGHGRLPSWCGSSAPCQLHAGFEDDVFATELRFHLVLDMFQESQQKGAERRRQGCPNATAACVASVTDGQGGVVVASLMCWCFCVVAGAFLTS